MIKVFPAGQRVVGQHVNHGLFDAAGDGIVVAGSLSDRDFTFLDKGLSPAKKLRLPKEPKSLSLSRDGRLLCVATWNGLQILSTQGFETLYRLEGKYECARFTPDGMMFWCVRRFDDLSCEVQIREARRLALLKSLLLVDPFADTCFELFPHPMSKGMALYGVCGQEGSWVWWMDSKAEPIVAEPVLSADSTCNPCFTSAGDMLVCQEMPETHELQVRSLADRTILRTLRLSFSDRSQDPPRGLYVISESRVLVCLESGCLFVLDSRSMAMESIAIAGHEPTEIDDGGRESDLWSVAQVSQNRFVSVHYTGELKEYLFVQWSL